MLISLEKVFFFLEIFISRKSKHFLIKFDKRMNRYIYVIIYYNKISKNVIFDHLMIEFSLKISTM